MPHSLFNGKLVLVIGGASGLSAVCIREVIDGGGRVVVLGAGRDDVGQTFPEQLAAGVDAAFFYVDASRWKSIHAALDAMSERFGRLDTALDSAGRLGSNTSLTDCVSGRSDGMRKSNLSSISITPLPSALSKPDRFVGVHFCSPVPVMLLIELIRTLQTSGQRYASALDVVSSLGKRPINVANGPRFVVNRILCPMINEAICVLQEGLANAEEIDADMKLGCNYPLGPLALADMIGLDTLLAVMEVLCEHYNDPKYRPAQLLREMVGARHFGRKTGRGFYRYPG
jgi:hypothetical protein